MNPFAVDYTDLASVIRFARRMADRSPRFVQYVVKYPDRDNYNITMQADRAVADGAAIVWQSDKN